MIKSPMGSTFNRI